MHLIRRLLCGRPLIFRSFASSSRIGPPPETAAPQNASVISEIFNCRLNERCRQLLTHRQLSEEELRISLGLLDVNSFLQSVIASSSAQRQGQLSGLSTVLQQTLDSVRDGLGDLRGEIQASGNSVHASTRQQRLQGELQQREGVLGVALGEFRTKCEAVKLRAIYSFTMGIAALFLAIVIESSRKQKRDRDRSSSAAKQHKFKEDFIL